MIEAEGLNQQLRARTMGKGLERQKARFLTDSVSRDIMVDLRVQGLPDVFKVLI